MKVQELFCEACGGPAIRIGRLWMHTGHEESSIGHSAFVRCPLLYVWDEATEDLRRCGRLRNHQEVCGP